MNKFGGLGIGFLLTFLMIAPDAFASRFFLDPVSDQFRSGCEVAVNIKMDTAGQAASAADAIIKYNPSEIEIVDQDFGLSGIQIRKGNLFDVYPGNIVKSGEGKIYLTGFNIFSQYQGSGTYGAVVFKSRPGVTSTQLSFDFVSGSTIDSNIADKDSKDTLTSVSGGTYTFVPASFCNEDTGAPTVTNQSPAPNSTGNALSSNVTFNISDSQSGVDIHTLVAKVDSKVYKEGTPGFSYTGSPLQYSVTIDPQVDFLSRTPVFIEIDAADISGNLMNTVRYSFNEPIQDSVPPYVTGSDPTPGSKDNPLSSNVVLHVRDDLSGVDLNTVSVNVDGVNYKINSTGFSYSGNKSDYFIVIDPLSDFASKAPVFVEVTANDLAGNAMNTYLYSFNHPDEDVTPPYVENSAPQPGELGVPLDANITFRIRDNLAGVDIDTLFVKMDGKIYNSDSPELTFFGSSKNYSIAIDPLANLSDQEITVEIDVTDFRGNVMPTYVYRFNKTPICGNGIVEQGEQCELPNSGACTESCQIVACEIIEEGISICGNGIVEGDEQCEPPGFGLCDDVCKLGSLDILELPPFERLPEEKKQALLRLNMDEDKDGLPDVIEILYGTQYDSDDSDADGTSDLEEILDYGSDPSDSIALDVGLKIVNWKNGDVTGSRRLFVKGVATADKNVKVFAISAEGAQFFLGETIADKSFKFAVFSDIDLEQGVYFLEAHSFEKNGELIDKSAPVKITIDFAKSIPAPKVKSISDVPVVQGLDVVVFDNQPVVFGSTAADSQVFVVFESLIYTSTVISDSLTGFFTVYAPRPLEVGDHAVTVYAVTPDGITSDPLRVGFTIRGALAIAIQDFKLGWVLAAVGLIAVVSYFIYRSFFLPSGYFERRKRKKLEKEIKRLRKE